MAFAHSQKLGITVACVFVILFGIRCARRGKILIGSPGQGFLWEGAPVAMFGVIVIGLAMFAIYFFDAGWSNAL
jgi:hypothetical protein